ncbi:uncharacterized protein LOC112457898 isoform X1 [Temnothorax curvispinosus]|uniref:Uncharacterized protein LOC112457898 isoform X1 n=2 Tax=Temnothorax curvispinosus TaxID=300111 RepID=A0A6J1Q462_9HYME|nr:uncharacterized protein LOC112457898 isoform X1 [Temnothorax curvispinosus]XP_024876967.1 uncharacterized protein LOC112457898 isoform X1 [Temnothorax curvispinosus]XP_024876968.1 uncharacterized protein LOC112457898 isoform X1 [Temnothorax curvispinosus]
MPSFIHCDKFYKRLLLWRSLYHIHYQTINLYYRTVIIALTRKRSKLWNYFEKLNHSLVKCTTCKKEIKTPNPTRRTKIMKAHILNVHGISLDDETVTLPDDLKQYYSELPGYKAKCNNCGVTLSFLRDVGSLRKHLRRHSTRIQSQDETTPTKKRSKLWNYFEELNPSLVKCTTCKKEIKISCPSNRTPIFRAHLNRHGIFLDNDTVTLPDDLRQCYSKLPGYKAKCNNCGETISFLKTVGHLRTHLRRHSTITQSRDKTVMVPRKKRSKFWNYFEKLKPSLVKCTICKKEIKVSHLTDYTRIFRAHLFKKHGLSLDDDTLTLPDDLKQCFSKLPGYKAKCNNCGKAVSFLSSIDNLRKHLRRHSTRIQNRDETVIMAPRRKYSKLWNYFKELNPSLIKCTTCKKKIKVSHPENCIKIMRVHLSRHGIFIHNDTHTLPDDLKQYYSELPKYKAKCKYCGEAVSFLTSMRNLREHLRRRHFTTIQSRYKTAQTKKRSKLWNYFEEFKPSLVKCTTCKKKIKIPHPKSRTTIFRAHLLNVHGISLGNEIRTLPDDLRQYYSELPGYKAKCNNCGKVVSFFTNIENLRDHLRRHSTRIQSRNETVMVPRKKRSKLWTYFEKLKPSLVKCVICKIKIYMPHPSNSTAITMGHLNKHGIFFNNDTFALPDDLRQHYSELPRYKAKCNDCGKKMSLLKNIVRLRKHLRRHSTRILSRDEPSTSSLADDNVGPSARCQGQDDTSGLLVQSFIKERTEKTGALNEPGTLISTDYNTNPTAECESQETVDLDRERIQGHVMDQALQV